MCTVVVSFAPSAAVPVLVAGVRDEFLDRPWQPPDHHWPDRPALIGGRDLQAGGTWLAVDTAAHRVACVLNGWGRPAPERNRMSRGELPLRLATDGKLGDFEPERLDPFHLLCGEPDTLRMFSWDGLDLIERRLEPGLHVVVNSGLEGRRPGHGVPGADGAEVANGGDVAEGAEVVKLEEGEGGERDERRTARLAARIGHFRPRLAAADRPSPWDGPTAAAWGAWLPLVDGDGLEPTDPRALVIGGDGVGGRSFGTTSISLVALSVERIRYDFCAVPGNGGGAWFRVL
jgi:transport and Golgi organization protein 2